MAAADPADRHADLRAGRAAPDEPAVTCDGRTLTRGELDASTNRLARAYAELGVRPRRLRDDRAAQLDRVGAGGAGRWKLGAIPQPLSARLPGRRTGGSAGATATGLAGRPRRPRRRNRPASQAISRPIPRCRTQRTPKSVSPVWKSMASGGSTGRPKLIEAGGDSRLPAAVGLSRWAPRRATSSWCRCRCTHNTGFTTFADRADAGPPPGADAALRTARVPPAGHRAPGHVPGDGADDHAAAAARVPRRPRCLRPVVDPAVLAPGRAVPARGQAGLDRSARARGGLGALRRHRTSGADVHHRRPVAEPSAARSASSSPAR